MGDYESFTNFLMWLREYNESTQKKVHIVGNDVLPVFQLSLYQYHIALLGEKASLPYLRLIMDTKYSELIELAKTDSMFLKKIDKQQFEFYQYVVASCNKITDGENREFEMAQRTLKAMEVFVRNDEKAIIHMHSAHLISRPHVDDGVFNRKATGYYLKDKCGSSFFTISFQIGEGEYTDDLNPYSQQSVTSLFTPMPQSFESVAGKVGLNYFFYPSSYLEKDIIFYNRISRGGLTKEKDVFASARKGFDGFIYIRKSTPLKDVEPFPAFYMSDYINANMRKIESMIVKN